MNDPGAGCEHDYALAVMNGAAPMQVFNVVYAAFRLSTSGADVRDGRATYRDPQVWLSDDMCRRTIGTPVMTSIGAVGSLCVGFVKDCELWGVARLYHLDLPLDRLAAELNIVDGQQTVVPLPDGGAITIEGAPRLLDYVGLILQEPRS